VRADPTRVTPDYLAYLFQAHLAKRYFLKVAHRTTNLASINSRKLKSLPTPIPSLEEQRSISSMLESVDAKIQVEEQRREVLSLLFQSLLHHLMTGKVRVPMGEAAPEAEEVTA
jgi:type I restriction enzyme, S subunit